MGLLYLRAEDQDGRVYELVSDGEFQPLPNVGDNIELNDITAKVEARTFFYGKPKELALLLRVHRFDDANQRGLPGR